MGLNEDLSGDKRLIISQSKDSAIPAKIGEKLIEQEKIEIGSVSSFTFKPLAFFIFLFFNVMICFLGQERRLC